MFMYVERFVSNIYIVQLRWSRKSWLKVDVTMIYMINTVSVLATSNKNIAV